MPSSERPRRQSTAFNAIKRVGGCTAPDNDCEKNPFAPHVAPKAQRAWSLPRLNALIYRAVPRSPQRVRRVRGGVAGTQGQAPAAAPARGRPLLQRLRPPRYELHQPGRRRGGAALAACAVLSSSDGCDDARFQRQGLPGHVGSGQGEARLPGDVRPALHGAASWALSKGNACRANADDGRGSRPVASRMTAPGCRCFPAIGAAPHGPAPPAGASRPPPQPRSDLREARGC